MIISNPVKAYKVHRWLFTKLMKNDLEKKNFESSNLPKGFSCFLLLKCEFLNVPGIKYFK